MTKIQKPLVIGLGNSLRGDDGFGVLAAGKLMDREDIDCQVLHGNATEILATWQGYEKVLILDAIDVKGETPGTLREINLKKEAPPVRFFKSSSHGMGIYEALELGKALDDCPQELRMIGVVAIQFDIGACLSPQVSQSIEPTLTLCNKILSSWT